MPLTKDIEILEMHLLSQTRNQSDDLQNAILRSIKAMKAIQIWRTTGDPNVLLFVYDEKSPLTSYTPTKHFYLNKLTGAITPKPTKHDPKPPAFAFSPKSRSYKRSDANPDRHTPESLDLNPPKSLKSTTSSPNQQNPPRFIRKHHTTAPQMQNNGVIY